MAKPSLFNGQIYHIYNRGVDKRNIFSNTDDHQRFSDGLIIFNNIENLNGNHFADLLDCDDRSPMVNIIAYCLMPNHFHLLLEQLVDDGIARFLQKMSTSYTMYFNKKYQRNGALLQGTFKRSHIKSDSKLLEMSKYIHFNPYKILRTENDTAADIGKNYSNTLGRVSLTMPD